MTPAGIALVVIGIVSFYGMLWLWIAKMNEDKQRRIFHENELRAQLIHDMLERNLSVDEIERIITAFSKSRSKARDSIKEYMSLATQPSNDKPKATHEKLIVNE